MRQYESEQEHANINKSKKSVSQYEQQKEKQKNDAAKFTSKPTQTNIYQMGNHQGHFRCLFAFMFVSLCFDLLLLFFYFFYYLLLFIYIL